MQDPASELLRIPLFPRRWVNRRYDASSVDDPGYTDTVREDFDRIADLSEAERVGPEAGHGASSSGVTLKLKTSSITPRSRSVARNANLAPLNSPLRITLFSRSARATVSSKFGVATAT